MAKVRQEREDRKRLNQSGDAGGSAPPEVPLESPTVRRAPASNAGRAKIKFVIGETTLAHEFAAGDTLATLRAFLCEQGYSGFSLETVFPRRTLTPELDSNTLAELNLTPACAIVVSLNPGASLRGVGGRISSVFSRGNAVGNAGDEGRNNAAPRAAAQPTIHPNLDSTYIHPNDEDTFINDLWNAFEWVKRKFSNCTTRTAPAAARAGNAPSDTRAAARARRSGPYESLPNEEF